MSTIRVLFAVSGFAILAAAGCADPGVVQVNPTNMPVGKRDAGTKKDAGKTEVKEPVEADDEDTGETDDVASDDVETDDKEVTDESDDETPVKPVDAGKVDAGKVVDAGKTPDAGSAKPDDALPACPDPYSCMNPAGPLEEMGLEGTITDPDGKPVEFSCAKGGQETCDPKDPKKSCPNFSKPFCAHVKLSGLIAVEIDQCAQKCSP